MSEVNREIVYLAIGSGSMCWQPTPAGVFDPSAAILAGQPVLDAMDKKDAEIDRLTAVLEAVVAGDLNLSWTIRGYWYQSGKIHPYRYGPFDSISELAASISQAAERQKVTSERT